VNFSIFFNGGFSALFVFLAVGLCIFIHELGHFLVAKWRGLHVIAFSMGFKKIWGKKYGGVEYRIGCIPFGGYVELPQIDSSGEAKDENGNVLPKAKPLDKILTAFAGPFCNILLGAAFASVIWFYGLPSESPQMSKIEVAQVEEGSPEYNAGLRAGDIIETVNGKSFNYTWRDFVEKIIFNVGYIELGVKRGNQPLTISYVPGENDKKFPGEKIAYPFFSPRVPVVVKPIKGSQAEKAGIIENDIVLAVNGIPVRDSIQFNSLIDKNKGRNISLTVSRKNETMEISGLVPEKDRDAKDLYRIGVQYSREMPLTIVEVIPDSPAYLSGIKPGDVILRINEKAIDATDTFYDEIQNNKENSIKLEISRDGGILRIEGIKAELISSCNIGTLFAYYEYPTPLDLLVQTVEKSYKTLRGIFSKKSKLKARNLSGPIGIVHNVGKIVYLGNIVAAIYFLAFISYSLAIFNLLPLPVLDGGHILVAFAEAVIGRPLPEKMLEPVYVTFIILLVGLMIFVTYYDILRLIRDIR